MIPWIVVVFVALVILAGITSIVGLIAQNFSEERR
jgi:Flp pilus assembly pilin Flp